MAALLVRFEERPHQEHGGAGRADEARGEGSHAEKRRVHAGRGHEITLDPHAAADHVEREQEHDEGHVFREKRIGEHRPGHAPRRACRRRRDGRVRREMKIHGVPVREQVIRDRDEAEHAGHEKLARIVLPPMRRPRRERQDRDCRQEQAEGQHGDRRRRRAGVGIVGGAMLPRLGIRMGVGGLCGHQQITTMLRPAGQRRCGVGSEQEGDEGERGVGAAGRGVGVVRHADCPWVRPSGEHRTR